MFTSRDEATDFAYDIVQVLDGTETDGWHVSPTFEGAHVLLGDNVGCIRGRLDGEGYRVLDRTDDETRKDNWAAKLEVRPS